MFRQCFLNKLIKHSEIQTETLFLTDCSHRTCTRYCFQIPDLELIITAYIN